jgi:hypothetical protein
VSDVSTPQAAASIAPPDGIEQIVSTFGDIFAYINEDHTLNPAWQADHLVAVPIPFALALSWDHSRHVQRVTCHKLLQPVFEKAFVAIVNAGLESKVASFGGCFSFRPQRTGAKLSVHSWGIAIDLNPESNAQGTVGTMDAGIISIFQDLGFVWGGGWRGLARDPMHFQFCSGY